MGRGVIEHAISMASCARSKQEDRAREHLRLRGLGYRPLLDCLDAFDTDLRDELRSLEIVTALEEMHALVDLGDSDLWAMPEDIEPAIGLAALKRARRAEGWKRPFRRGYGF